MACVLCWLVLVTVVMVCMSVYSIGVQYSGMCSLLVGSGHCCHGTYECVQYRGTV